MTELDSARAAIAELRDQLDVPDGTKVHVVSPPLSPALFVVREDRVWIVSTRESFDQHLTLGVIERFRRPDGTWESSGSLTTHRIADAAEHIHWRTCVAAGISA